MDVLRRWRQWIRPTCFTFYFICLMIAVPLCILELNRKGAPDHVQAWFIGGIFVMMAVPISFWGILQHLIYYTQPELQRHIIRYLLQKKRKMLTVSGVLFTIFFNFIFIFFFLFWMRLNSWITMWGMVKVYLFSSLACINCMLVQ